MNEIWKWSALETSERIKSGAVSVREVTQANLDRLDAVNPIINAIAEPVNEALDVADKMDAAGVPEDAGPLYGIPATTKINVDHAGYATSNGLIGLKDNLADTDSPVVANLRKAGAVLIGRSNAPEFSFRYFTSNDLHGNTLNPWDKTRTPGGSSGGAAVAVASGIGAIAHGNDMAGSLRYPAFCCGVTAIRPSFGRVPAYNPGAAEERPGLAQTISVQGPIARSVGDLRLALHAMSMRDSRDPMWTNAQDSGRARSDQLTAGYCLNPFDFSIDSAIEKAIEIAVQGLRDCGIDVREVTPPNVREIAEIWGTLAIGETECMIGEAVRQQASHPMRRVFEELVGHFGPIEDTKSLLSAIRDRVTFQRNWSMMFDKVDLLVMPTSLALPFRNDADLEDPTLVRKQMKANQPLYIVNALGLPSVALPTHLTGNVPSGVQIIGPMHDDWFVLDVAERLEAQIGVVWRSLPEPVISPQSTGRKRDAAAAISAEGPVRQPNLHASIN